jgi:hypothetical protein
MSGSISKGGKLSINSIQGTINSLKTTFHELYMKTQSKVIE